LRRRRPRWFAGKETILALAAPRPKAGSDRVLKIFIEGPSSRAIVIPPAPADHHFLEKTLP
jgi:hypothetical protein